MKTNLENKWRLPTKEEFKKVLYPNIEKIPNLKQSLYWSSSLVRYCSAWSFSLISGLAYSDRLNLYNQVRPVRDVSSDSPNLSKSTIIGNLEVLNKDIGKLNYFDAVDAVEKLNNIKIKL